MATFTLNLGSLCLERPLIVADITDDVLLGADIMMEDEKADILLSRGIMLMKGIEIPLKQKVVTGIVRKVHLADNYTIPAMSEMIADVFVDRQDNENLQTSWLIEPSPLLAEKYAVAMASSLVNPVENVTVKIRLMNPFSTDIVLPQDTTVGFASPVSEMEIFQDHEDAEECSNFEDTRRIKLTVNSQQTEVIRKCCPQEQLEEASYPIPDHLKELFMESTKDRSSTETKIVADLLIRNEDVFSRNELDLGLTHLTEHVIDTGDSPPIKHRPRPVPLAFANEDRAAVEKLLEQGSVRPSTSPWASAMVFVRKKKWRSKTLCGLQETEFSEPERCIPPPKNSRLLGCSIWIKVIFILRHHLSIQSNTSEKRGHTQDCICF